MEATRFNGIMMRIIHGDRVVFLERNGGSYRVIQTTPIVGGLSDSSAVFGDLGDPGNLQEFINYISEKLGLQ